jgi:hypothetical protein
LASLGECRLSTRGEAGKVLKGGISPQVLLYGIEPNKKIILTHHYQHNILLLLPNSLEIYDILLSPVCR